MNQKRKLFLHKNLSPMTERDELNASLVVDGTLARAAMASIKYKNNLGADHLRLFQGRIQQLKEGVHQLSFILAELNEVLHQSSTSFNESL